MENLNGSLDSVSWILQGGAWFDKLGTTIPMLVNLPEKIWKKK